MQTPSVSFCELRYKVIGLPHVNDDCLMGSSDLDCGRVPGKLEDAAVMEPAVTTTPLVEVTTVRK